MPKHNYKLFKSSDPMFHRIAGLKCVKVVQPPQELVEAAARNIKNAIDNEVLNKLVDDMRRSRNV